MARMTEVVEQYIDENSEEAETVAGSDARADGGGIVPRAPCLA